MDSLKRTVKFANGNQPIGQVTVSVNYTKNAVIPNIVEIMMLQNVLCLEKTGK